MSLSLSDFSIYLSNFIDKTNKLNDIILSIKSLNIIKTLHSFTRNNLYKNSLRIAIESFENYDHSYLNSLNPDEIYQAYIEFSNKFNINICRKKKLFLDHNIEQYGIIDYIELLINIPYLPIKIKNELDDFIDGKSSLCVYCGCNMKLQYSNLCYDENSLLYCDFTRQPIQYDNNVLHCLGSRNTHHCNGFDISVDNSSVYFNDLMDKRLEKRIYNDLLNNKYTIDETDLRFIYSVICSNMIPSTIIYYNSIYNDLLYFRNNYSLYSNNYMYKINTLQIMNSHLNQMKRILIAGNKNWKLECNNLIHNTTLEINSELTHFKNTLSLDNNIYFTQNEKDNNIKNHRIKFNDIIASIKNKIELIKKYNTILDHLENISLINDISTIYTYVDTEVYKIYQLLETLEKSTPIENKIPITIVSTFDNNDTCSICLELLYDETIILTTLFNLSGIDHVSSELYSENLVQKNINKKILVDFYNNNYQQFTIILNDINITYHHFEKLIHYLHSENQLKISIEIFKINNCNHLFHKHCLNKWLQINNSCPLCRKDSQKLIF